MNFNIKGTLKNNQLFVFSLLVAFFLLVVLVTAVTKDYISVDVINTSSNGFTLTSTNGITVNGSQPYFLNTSAVLNINISLIRNGTHGGYPNVTFSWVLSRTNGSTMLNATIQNMSGAAGTGIFNQSAFNYSFNSAVLLPDGYYNISIYVWNVSEGATLVLNYSRGIDVLVDNFAPIISSFWYNMSSNNSNISSNRKLTINATVSDTIYTQSVRFGIRNTFNNVTEFNLTAVLNTTTTFFSAELNTALLGDGIYTITVYANDSLKHDNVTISNLTFVLDRTGPNVTNVFLGNWTNGANISASLASATGNFVFNITAEINDSLSPNAGNGVTNTMYVSFNITNSTGQINYTLGRPNTTIWNSSLKINISDTRYFPDGKYYILVSANDSLDNFNRSTNLTFTIDRTLPSVSVACSPSEATVGQMVTCTCSASDSGSGLVAGYGFGGSTTESTTAAGSGSFTSSVCSVRDYAGNLNTATGTWTVTAASSGGGGGSSGSGGGSSSVVPGQIKKEVWTSINAGETAKVEVANGAIGVTEVSFSVATTTYGAWVQVKKLDSLPSSVEAFDNTKYRALEITQQNVQKALQGEATVKFKVEKSWLSDNSVAAANVALFRYVGGDWTALPTTMGEDDGTYVHYSATTPGFSYFVIGEAVTAAVSAVEETAPVEEVAPEEAPVEEAAAEASAATEATASAKSNAVVWIVPLVVLLLVAGLLYWYWQRR